MDFGRAVAVALHALGQVMLDGLFQGPVAKADDVAVVGVGKETGDAFGAAQLYVNVGGVGGGTEGQGGKRKCGEFGHAQILFSVWAPRNRAHPY
ncbi:hypothetical protein D3C80_1879100 [compost metagenome]